MSAIIAAIVGLVIALLLKRFLLVPDKGKALFAGYLEFPVDANLAAFMFGMGSISSIAVSDNTPTVLLSLVALLILSVLIWKHSCSTLSDRDGEVFFAKPWYLSGLTIMNCALTVASFYIVVSILGVQQ